MIQNDDLTNNDDTYNVYNVIYKTDITLHQNKYNK